MMQKIYITEGDSEPDIGVQLTDENGNPADLTGTNTTVNFRVVRPRGQGSLLDKQCKITDASNGKVVYDWSANDTSEYGRFRGEFVVNYDNGDVETFPNSGYHTVIIKRNAEA